MVLRMKWKISWLITLLVIFLSGCTNFPGIPAGMQKPQTVQETHDLIVIEDIRVTPSLVYPDSDITVSFRLKHVGDPKTSEKVEVDVKVYDAGPCKIIKGKRFSETLHPQETKYLTVELKAPSQDIVAGIPKKCPVRIKLSYTYNAKTQVEAYVMSENKFKRLEQAGKAPYYSPKQYIGIGPVKIYFEFAQPQPFIARKQVTFLVHAKNLGQGDVENKKVNITFNLVGQKKPINCPAATDLQFIKGETRKVRCTWKPTLGGEEEKTFYLVATMEYKYVFEKVIDIEVKPLPR